MAVINSFASAEIRKACRFPADPAMPVPPEPRLRPGHVAKSGDWYVELLRQAAGEWRMIDMRMRDEDMGDRCASRRIHQRPVMGRFIRARIDDGKAVVSEYVASRTRKCHGPGVGRRHDPKPRDQFLGFPDPGRVVGDEG